MQAAAANDYDLEQAGTIAALLLALGIGGGAWFAARSRRSKRTEQAAYALPDADRAEPDGTAVLEPQPAMPAFATVADVDGESVVRPAARRRPAVEERIGSEELAPPPTSAAPSDVRQGPLPQTRADRDAWLTRMADAPRTTDNPFTSRKARLRRARLILQRLEQEQNEAAANPFDWRTYSPSTRHPTPATPARVTA